MNPSRCAPVKCVIALGICAAFAICWRVTKPAPPQVDAKAEAEEEISFSPPDDATNECINRISKKEAVVSAMMAGDVSLPAAVQRFEELTAESEEALALMRRVGRGETDQEKLLRQVLAYAHLYRVREPDIYSTRWAQLESEARSLISQPVQFQ